MMRFDSSRLVWTRQPKTFSVSDDKITITTEPHTDLWQRTYYGSLMTASSPMKNKTGNAGDGAVASVPAFFVCGRHVKHFLHPGNTGCQRTLIAKLRFLN